MLLKNYWEWKRICEITIYSSAETITETGLIDLDGNNISMLTNSYSTSSTINGYVINNRVLLTRYFIHLGTGTTPPQRNDYHLESKINDLSNVTYSRNSQIDEQGKYTKNIIIVGANNTDSDIEVTEWGYCKNIQKSTNSNDYSTVMLVREVLKTPIILEANKGFSITVTWTEE